MKDLVKGLLEYSLLEKSNLLVAVDCNKVVNEVLSDLNDAINANNAKVTVQELPQILAYATELRLLFQNLLNNAILTLFIRHIAAFIFSLASFCNLVQVCSCALWL
jgi:light-regulated signal transduction histidine kinase (bacteriophytochrome)